MDIRHYQDFTPSTFVYSEEYNVNRDHCLTGILAEAGEVAGCFQKFHRGDYGHDTLRDRLIKELGGLMYYTAQFCNVMGIDLNEVVKLNMEILMDRQKRGVIKGDGDDR